MLKTSFIISFILFYTNVFSQKDSSFNKSGVMEEVVITSTRTETKLGNVAVPTKIISKKYIQNSGSLKLQDILQEFTGITVVNSNLATSLNGYPNPFGQGIQMLGLDPAYTAVLIDGEPLVGRNAGILKLGRIATGNIHQIEIVKGPSSSLYGSESLAGVINIITAIPSDQQIDLQSHVETNKTLSQTVAYTNNYNKTGIQFFINRYSTDGYDLDPNIYGKTISPFRDWNSNIKLTQQINKKTDLILSYRNFNSKQDCNYMIEWQSNPAVVKGYTSEKDNTFFAQLTYKASARNKLFFRTFADHYSNTSFANLEKTDTRFDETSFIQSILKPEIQFENIGNKRKLIGGAGTYIEMIDASRYSGKKQLLTLYTFMQNEWFLYNKKLTLIAGARLDKRNDYQLNLSPRAAIAYKPNIHWKITGSAGFGFKAPDFRHMYLDFYNSQIGYSLIGSDVLSAQLLQLQQQGELASGANITPFLNTPSLLPEKSFGTHIGAKYTRNKLTVETGIFRNDINNLIDVYLLPFKKTNYRSIYSYHNINRIFTQGTEIDLQYCISKAITLSLGYQYLEAKDKNILDQIKAGKVYKRDPVTYQTTLVTRDNYYGLSNRSHHSFNAKFLWENKNKKTNIFIRTIYRGQYGYSDINGNNIIDDEREMVKGFWNLKFSAERKIIHGLSAQIGCDNILNYTNPAQMPDIAGRLFFININYSFNHLINKH